MNWLEAIILGIVQGITEFLPISSSAHLIIIQELFGLEIEGLAFEVFLHLASLLAVIIYFYKDLVTLFKEFFQYIGTRHPQYKTSFFFSLYLVLATLITAILGVPLESFMGNSLKSMTTIAISLVVTGILLMVIERGIRYGNRQDKDLNVLDAIIMGLGQTFAVIPGISRSGSTLVIALWRGMDKPTAVRFSFLLSIPVILGSTILMLPDMNAAHFQTSLGALAASFISSFVFAVISIKWLINFLNRGKLTYFAYYCFFIGGITFLFLR